MSARRWFDDPDLGRVSWDEEREVWQCSLMLRSGRAVPCLIVCEDDRQPFQDRTWEELRTRIKWLREHEPAVRSRIAEMMFDGWRRNWYDEAIDAVTTVEQFGQAISLDGINVYEDRTLHLIYEDGQLFGGHAITVPLGAEGQFIAAPYIWFIR